MELYYWREVHGKRDTEFYCQKSSLLLDIFGVCQPHRNLRNKKTRIRPAVIDVADAQYSGIFSSMVSVYGTYMEYGWKDDAIEFLT